MVGRVLTRSSFYHFLGTLLVSAGVLLGCTLASRIVREEIDARVAQQASLLVIARTPEFAFPPATPLPTLTPTPVATATPIPGPAVRLVVPAIGLNTNILETQPVSLISWDGSEKMEWQPVAYAVGHYDSSGYPGEGTNIVLAGHNNTLGAVFRNLPDLSDGDDVVLYSADYEFHYTVREKIIVPYRGHEAEADAILQSYSAPTPGERVTLISCWPYATNSDRIVVIAMPATGAVAHDH